VALKLTTVGGADPFQTPTQRRTRGAPASGLVIIELVSAADGDQLLTVQDQQDPITFTIPLDPDPGCNGDDEDNANTNTTDSGTDIGTGTGIGNGHTCAVDTSGRLRPYATVACTFWDSRGEGGYSSEGCATLPSPAPSALRWRAWEEILEVATSDANWGVGGEGEGVLPFYTEEGRKNWTLPGSSLATALDLSWTLVETPATIELLANCLEVYATVEELENYAGADLGMRKYTTKDPRSDRKCEISRENNTIGCWWEWRAQAFVGGGCVFGEGVECACIHLTAFQVRNPRNPER
jgi:hypothetical protein